MYEISKDSKMGKMVLEKLKISEDNADRIYVEKIGWVKIVMSKPAKIISGEAKIDFEGN